MSDDLTTLFKLTVKNTNIINLLALQLADSACLLVPALPKCTRCADEPVTVEHSDLHIRLCDRCAAETIVAASRQAIASTQHDVGAFVTLATEGAWVDVEDAEKIRRVTDYVRLVKMLDVEQIGSH